MKIFQDYANSVYGFRADCSSLIKKFKLEEKNDYTAFVTLWRTNKFYIIYEKYRNSGFDNNQFKQDTLEIAKKIMLCDHFVGGLFLLFGLYYVQIDPKATIRLELGEFEMLLNNIQEEKKSMLETFQQALIVTKLLKNNAFSFVRFSREFTIEGMSRARLVHNEPDELIKDERVQHIYWLKRKTADIDILKELGQVNQKYSQLKAELQKEHPELNLGLDMIPSDIIGGLQNSLVLVPSMKTKSKESTKSIGERRHALKNRKMDVKNRYAKLEPDDLNQPSTSSISEPAVKRRAGGGTERISYLKRMVNESDSGSESDFEGEEKDSVEEPVLKLPDI